VVESAFSNDEIRGSLFQSQTATERGAVGFMNEGTPFKPVMSPHLSFPCALRESGLEGKWAAVMEEGLGGGENCSRSSSSSSSDSGSSGKETEAGSSSEVFDEMSQGSSPDDEESLHLDSREEEGSDDESSHEHAMVVELSSWDAGSVFTSIRDGQNIDPHTLTNIARSMFMSSMQQAFEGGTEEKEGEKEEEDGSVPSPHVGTRRGGLVFGFWSKVPLG
jgi:hypothetical protein